MPFQILPRCPAGLQRANLMYSGEGTNGRIAKLASPSVHIGLLLGGVHEAPVHLHIFVRPRDAGHLGTTHVIADTPSQVFLPFRIAYSKVNPDAVGSVKIAPEAVDSRREPAQNAQQERQFQSGRQIAARTPQHELQVVEF